MEPLFYRRSPHIPGRRADDLFFGLNHEPESFVEIDVFRSIGFEVTRSVFLVELLNITIHERCADSLSLSLGGNADGAEMQVRLVGVQMAPSGEPLDKAWDCFAERTQ